MPLYWLCYRHNNQISVVIEPCPIACSCPHAAIAKLVSRGLASTSTPSTELRTRVDKLFAGHAAAPSLRTVGLIAGAARCAVSL
jgi:hypothetical protein